jgi:hypothetical protein
MSGKEAGNTPVRVVDQVGKLIQFGTLGFGEQARATGALFLGHFVWFAKESGRRIWYGGRKVDATERWWFVCCCARELGTCAVSTGKKKRSIGGGVDRVRSTFGV